MPQFKPGQFLHLALDPYEPGGFWPESRVFSIASSPTERDRLAITYAVKGAYTTRMERELAPGSSVWVKLPYGEFVVDPARDAVLFAGGTGITAFTAFLSRSRPERAAVLLFYGARTQEPVRLRSARPGRARKVAFAYVHPRVRRDRRPSPGRSRLAGHRGLPRPCLLSLRPAEMLTALSEQLRGPACCDSRHSHGCLGVASWSRKGFGGGARMRVLVTGGHGFIGRNLVDHLSLLHEVLAPRHAELDLGSIRTPWMRRLRSMRWTSS